MISLASHSQALLQENVRPLLGGNDPTGRQTMTPPQAEPLLAYLQIIEDDVTQHQVHLHIVQGLFIEFQGGVTEGQSLEEEMLSQFSLAQPVVQGS